MIKIDQEFKDLIPPLTTEEFSDLEQNIVDDGYVREKIILWNGVIIDGHNRYVIATKHNIPYETSERAFDCREDAFVWIIKNQLGRRNLNPYDRSLMAIKLSESVSMDAVRKKAALMHKINTDKLNEKIMSGPDGELKTAMLILNTIPTQIKSLNAKSDKIYIALDNNQVKIGASYNPETRLKDITRHRPKAKLIMVFPGNITIEKEIHKKLADYRLNNEWFEYGNVTKGVLKEYYDLYNVVQTEKSIDALNYASKVADVGRTTIAKVKVIEAQCSEETKSKIRSGSMTINRAYEEIKKQERIEKGISYSDPLERRICFYPNLNLFKLLIAYSRQELTGKGEMSEDIVKKFFDVMPEKRKTELKLFFETLTAEEITNTGSLRSL